MQLVLTFHVRPLPLSRLLLSEALQSQRHAVIFQAEVLFTV